MNIEVKELIKLGTDLILSYYKLNPDVRTENEKELGVPYPNVNDLREFVSEWIAEFLRNDTKEESDDITEAV